MKRSITQSGRNFCERRRTTRFASRNRYYQNAESIKFKSRYATRCGGQGWVVIDPVGVACIFQMFGLPRCGTLNWKHIAGSAAYMDHRWNEAMATRRPVIREPSISPIPATSIMRYEPKDFSYVACVLARSTFCGRSNSATLPVENGKPVSQLRLWKCMD